MNVFDAPATNYKSLDDIGKFNMIWHVSLVLIPIFLFLGVLHIVLGDNSWTTSLAALSIALINVVVLKKTLRYKLVGAWSVILSICVVQVSVFVINDSHLISDTMWCLLSAFFTFFLFGSIAGTFVLLTNLAGLTIFLLAASESDVLSKGIAIEQVDYRMVLNVFYVALALSWVIYKMIDNNYKINQRYEKQIGQNEVLMKEIHHRVKNNLQIISSLLKLQSAESNNTIVKDHFDEAINRIRSMALIHEKMYQKDDLTRIDIQSYLISLADEISNTIQSDTNIEFDVTSEIEEIDVESIVPLSLIVNELMTNSIKHGFLGVKNGSIDVRVHRKGELVEFVYLDNGTWKAPTEESTFGLELVATLTEQLDGTHKRTTEDGTRFEFTFPAKHILTVL